MSFRNRPCGIVHRGRCLLFSFHATCPVLQRKALSRCMQEIQDLSPRTYEHFIRIGPLKLGQSRTNQLSFFIRPHSKQPAVCCRQDHVRRPRNNSDHNAFSALVGRHTIHSYSTLARGTHAPDPYCLQRTRYASHFPRWLACHPQVSKYRLLASHLASRRPVVFPEASADGKTLLPPVHDHRTSLSVLCRLCPA